MAIQNFIVPVLGHVCGATTLAAKQFYFVGLNSSGTVEVCVSGDPGLLGVLLNKPGIGEVCQIAGPGSIVPVKMAALIAVGSLVKCHTDGTAVVCGDAAYSTGLNLEASAAAGEYCRCLIWFPNSIADVSLFSNCA